MCRHQAKRTGGTGGETYSLLLHHSCAYYFIIKKIWKALKKFLYQCKICQDARCNNLNSDSSNQHAKDLSHDIGYNIS